MENVNERNDSKKILANLGLDLEYIVPELFLAYKQRKRNTKIIDEAITSKLIEYYYKWLGNSASLNSMKKAFVTRYCNNESKLEGVNDDDHHGKEEIDGLRDVYEYIHSGEVQKEIITKELGLGDRRNLFFSIPDLTHKESSKLRDAIIASTGTELTLMQLHYLLYSHTKNPDAGYYMRNDDRYLPGTGTELCTWAQIGPSLKLVDLEVQKLLDEAKRIKQAKDVDALNAFIDRCVELKCKLILIHPFFDGNGRTVRAFINILLEEAGLPPIYVKSNERTQYHTAMNLANNESNFTSIKAFYKMKICDSIIELDINDRVAKLYQNEKGKVFGLKND